MTGPPTCGIPSCRNRPSSSDAMRSMCDRTAANWEFRPSLAWARAHRIDHDPSRSARRVSKPGRTSGSAHPFGRLPVPACRPVQDGLVDPGRGRSSAGGRHVHALRPQRLWQLALGLEPEEPGDLDELVEPGHIKGLNGRAARVVERVVQEMATLQRTHPLDVRLDRGPAPAGPPCCAPTNARRAGPLRAGADRASVAMKTSSSACLPSSDQYPSRSARRASKIATSTGRAAPAREDARYRSTASSMIVR